MEAEVRGLMQSRIWLYLEDLLWVASLRREEPPLILKHLNGREQLAGCAYLMFVLARTCRGQTGSLAYLLQLGFLLHSSWIPIFGV